MHTSSFILTVDDASLLSSTSHSLDLSLSLSLLSLFSVPGSMSIICASHHTGVHRQKDQRIIILFVLEELRGHPVPCMYIAQYGRVVCMWSSFESSQQETQMQHACRPSAGTCRSKTVSNRFSLLYLLEVFNLIQFTLLCHLLSSQLYTLWDIQYESLFLCICWSSLLWSSICFWSSTCWKCCQGSTLQLTL